MKMITVLGLLLATGHYANAMNVDCNKVDSILTSLNGAYDAPAMKAPQNQAVNEAWAAELKCQPDLQQVLQQARQMIQQECLKQNSINQ